jgi:hypothetical protein
MRSKSGIVVVTTAFVACLISMARMSLADITGFSGFSAANLAYPSGFTPSLGYSSNGSTFTLTDGHDSEATSGFYSTPQNVSSFTASFTFTCVGGDGGQYSNADGGSFVIQDDPRGSKALGGGGNSLGVAGASLLSPSAEFEFNLYGTGPGFIYATNGTPPPNFAAPKVVLDNGDPYNITLSFVNNSASVTAVDTVTHQVFTANTTGLTPLPQLLGSSTALVGFTGSTGGVASTQQISNFRFVSQPVFTPVVTTGWNQAMVVPNTAPLTNAVAAITATMDTGLAKTYSTFFEKGYDPSAPNDGLPLSGSTFYSEHDANHVFAMQSYSAKDAMLVDAASTTGTLTFSQPAAYTALSFLTASGNGPNAFDLTIHYTNGTSQTVPEIAAPDWFNNAPIAWSADDRVYPSTGVSSFDQESGNPNLYQEDVLLPDTVDPISSVNFSFDSGNSSNNGQLAIFAVSGVASPVPEPATLPLLAVSAIALLRRRGQRPGTC